MNVEKEMRESGRKKREQQKDENTFSDQFSQQRLFSFTANLEEIKLKPARTCAKGGNIKSENCENVKEK